MFQTLSFLTLYLLGFFLGWRWLRYAVLLGYLMYLFVVYIESEARYHRRCLRYHEEE